MQLLSMGGYEAYVWSTYGLAFIILVGNSFAVIRRKRLTRKKLQQWLVQ